MTGRIIRVLLATTASIAQRGLYITLRETPDMDVKDVTADPARIGAYIEHWRPDVVVGQSWRDGLSVVELAMETQLRQPSARVLALVASTHDVSLEAMLKAGVLGFLLVDETPQAAIEAVRVVSGGEVWFSKRLAIETATRALHHSETPATVMEAQLTERERGILTLLCQGLRNRDMARRLCLTEGTVRNHVSNIYLKLGVTSRCEAMAVAHEYGLVEISEHVSLDRGAT